ncbi:nucleocapsid protein [Grapevine associated cogu-like virus 4]|uniref:Nucleoprotein n=2 Tax=Phenuiviridae TaxID=1980418 RepID=A0A7D7FKV1_9VIRU|nr:nucleocapsid protein [Grapevine associated cogu-like virus 4]QMP81965.1 nucleocapsid protein [Grapevine associated cogu-like virus 4]QXN75422.1 MAG: hypothetical protein [Grapevine-associated phenui-like virus 1]
MALSRSDIEKVIQLVNSGDVETLKAEEFEQFQYQGFDPYKIVESLIRVKDDKTIANDAFTKDIYSMVAIGMIKGSVNSRNINKMSELGKTQVTELNAKYGIKEGGGKGQSSSVITYPRMMATFPDIAIRLVKVIGPKEFRGGPLLSTRLPSYMQVQVFPAIIPKDIGLSAKKMLLTASLCYSIDQSVQISQIVITKDDDLKPLAANQMNFTQVGHNSPVPAPEVRKAVFNKLSVKADYGMIFAVLQDYQKKIDSTFQVLSQADFETSIG